MNPNGSAQFLNGQKTVNRKPETQIKKLNFLHCNYNFITFLPR